MVTVVTRPEGHKIIDQAIAADITDSSGDALITFPYHGLGTGDTVYITSDIDEYNGFWYVTAIDVNTFKISEGSTTDFVEYYQDVDIDYYQTQEHDWSSIFLPIVYKCSNDRWPVNSIDTARTVSSSSDDNGFTNLNLSGVLKSSFNALEFLKITGAADDDLNRVWQIVEVISTSDITINLPYLVSNSFSGATVQYYYNNYQVKVKIYAGLNGSHPWVAKKPYAEVAELSLTPDDNNEVMFSVSDYIKIKVAIKNNLTLFSLPLNLDAFTGFYISLAESYDDSDNYSLSTNESAFIDDTFEGYAIAGKLPFKNLYSGDYGDYVYTSGSPALWLTNHSRLLAVEGYYFDVSFIKNILGDFILRMTKYFTSDYSVIEDTAYSDQGIGVYRLPITADANYESFCIQVYSALGEILNNSDFANEPGAGPTWTTGASPSVVEPAGAADSDFLFDDYAFIVGTQYTVVVNYNSSVSTLGAQISVRITDNSFNSQFDNGVDVIGTAGSSSTIPIVFTATALTTRIAIRITADSFDSVTITINTISVLEVDLAITEEICIDILETCESINQFTQDARRLLEDGGYRLLE